MAYDQSISTEVSLSRILDEMLVDDTDIDVVIEFLKSHESSISDIFKHSILAYKLYDINRNGIIFEFLAKNIRHLSDSNMLYATVTSLIWTKYSNQDGNLSKIIRDNGKTSLQKFKPSRGHLCGLSKDIDMVVSNIDIVDYLNSLTDLRDINHFICCSYMTGSALMYYNFSLLNPDIQYSIVKALVKNIERYSWYPDPLRVLLSELLVSLLKQLLFVNDIKLFNWVLNVIDTETNKSTANFLGNIIMDYIPNSLSNEIKYKTMGFEEAVFEMNMLDSQFDSLNLFLYVYVVNDNMLKTMKENQDLVEFFNLPFDWNELERLK